MTWQPGKTAPKSGNTILVYGKPKNTKLVQFTKAGIHTAYWDPIDQAFCLTGGTWEGPFIRPQKWQPTPEPPTEDRGDSPTIPIYRTSPAP